VKAEKDRQIMESLIEAKTKHIHDLENQLVKSMATLDEWKNKCDVITKEHDSQQQLHVTDLQTQEYVTNKSV